MGRSCQRVQLNSNTPLSRSNLIPNYPFQSFSVHYDGAKAHRRPLHRCSPARDPCSNVAACGHEYFGEAHSLRQLLAESTTECDYTHNGQDWSGTCATGQRQSPISIVTTNASRTSTEGLNLNFGAITGIKVINTGHFIQVEWDSLTGNTARIPSRGLWGTDPNATVALQPFQFHMHSTCEHAVDSFLCPLELHLVTRVDKDAPDSPEQCKEADKNCLAVFGVLNTFGVDVDAKRNTPTAVLFDTIIKYLPGGVGTKYATSPPSPKTFNLTTLLPANRTLAWYQGSLTSPPCSEDVSWHVFTQPKRELMATQLFALQEATATTYHETSCTANGSNATCNVPTGSRTNNRALQPTRGRQVYLAPAA